MKIKLSENEFYIIELPNDEVLSLVEFRGLMLRLNRLFKAFPDEQLNETALSVPMPSRMGKGKLKPLGKDRNLALSFVRAYKKAQNGQKCKSAREWFKNNGLEGVYRDDDHALGVLISNTMTRHKFTAQELS